MATIIQDYGPIYGEPVNGTVQGRPNGSVYVPLSNTVDISLAANTELYANGTMMQLSNYMTVVANSQDLSSYIQTQLFTDAACTTAFNTPRNLTVGRFNFSFVNFVASGSTAPTSGVSYYLRAQLMNNGVPVATSSVIEVVGR